MVISHMQNHVVGMRGWEMYTIYWVGKLNAENM